MQLLRIHLLTLLLGTLVVASDTFADSSGVTDEKIVFGQTACFTGPNQLLGRNYRAGILAAFTEQNRRGGVAGRRIELISLDDKYEPEFAAMNATRFANEENVLAVIGGVGTPTAERIVPVLRNSSIPFVGHVTGADFLTNAERFPNVVLLRASYADETRQLVSYMVSERGLKRFGIIYQDDAFGRSVLRSYLIALEEHRIPLLAKTRYTRNTHAVHASLFALDKADLDAILLVGTYAANAEIINLAESLGQTYTMANLSFTFSKELRDRINARNDRVIFTNVVPNPHDSHSEIVSNFKKALSATNPSSDISVNEVSLEGYLLGRYVVSTLDRVGDEITREAFLQTAISTQPVMIDDWKVAFKPGTNKGSEYVRLSHLGGDDEVISSVFLEGG